MRLKLVALALAVVFLLPGSVLAQGENVGSPANNAKLSNGVSESRPSFDTEAWVGSSIHSRADGRKLLCSMQNKSTSSPYNVTFIWDGRRITATIAQRTASAGAQSIQVSAQGRAIPSEGGAVSYLRTITGLVIAGETPLDTLRGLTALDVQIAGEAQVISVPLPGISSAIDKLAGCYNS